MALITLPDSLSHPQPRREDFRRTSNYLLARLSEQFRAPIRQVALRRSGGVLPKAPQEWREGLILGPSHIGDVLYNTASLPALRAGLPNCRWTYLASGASAEVLRGNPHLHRVIAVDDAGGFTSWLARARNEVAPYSFDAAIAYAIGSWRDLTLAASLGIPNRVGYVHKGFSGLVTHPVSIRVFQPFSAYFRDLVAQVTGLPPEESTSLRPLVYPGAEDEAAVDRISAKLGIDWSGPPVLACSVTSRQPSGIWPRENFLKSIQQAREKTSCTGVYLGAKSDAAELGELARRTGAGTLVLAGELGLPAVVAFLRRCRVAFTADSGLRHLANGAGIPVVFIRNISFRSEEAGAYCGTDHDMVSPDLKLVPPSAQPAAWAKIDPRRVGEELARLLRQ